MMREHKSQSSMSVIPAEAGIHFCCWSKIKMDPGFRREDDESDYGPVERNDGNG